MTGSKKLEETGPRESFSAAFNSLTDRDTPYPLSTQGFSDQPQRAMQDTLMGLSWEGGDPNANRWQTGSLSEVEGTKSAGEWRPWDAVARSRLSRPQCYHLPRRWASGCVGPVLPYLSSFSEEGNFDFYVTSLDF